MTPLRGGRRALWRCKATGAAPSFGVSCALDRGPMAGESLLLSCICERLVKKGILAYTIITIKGPWHAPCYLAVCKSAGRRLG